MVDSGQNQQRIDALEDENRTLRKERDVLAGTIRSVDEHYRTMVDNLGVGIYTLTDPIKGTFGSVNPALVRIFGYDSTEEVMALGSTVIAYENPEDRVQFIQDLLDNEFKEANTITVEVRLLKKDRSPIWVRITVHGTFDEENSLVRIDGVLEDITAYKMAQDALRESEQRFRRIFETAAVGMVISAPDGRVLQANPAFCRFLGYVPEELRSRRTEDLTHPDHREESLVRVEELRTNRHASIELEKRYVRKDGTVVWGHTTATSLFDEDGVRLNGIAIVQDITARKQMESDLLRMQKLESLSVLAGGIAHDFNNILTGVLGNVSLARSYVKNDDRQAARLERAERAANRARDLTMQLQTFARGGDPDRRTAYLGDVVREVAEFSLQGSKVRSELDLHGGAWPVEIDGGQIGQVVSNLLINAQQALPEGGTVRISTRNVELPPDSPVPLAAGRYVRLVVKDEGMGIEGKLLGRIFDPYFSTKATGSGLGLATSYSIIRKHDGYIGVESTPGEGTCFTIHLPAASGPEKPVAAPAVVGPTSGRGRILIMDDEEIVLETVMPILEEFGYEVEVTRDGDAALDAYREARDAGRPFDLVIMDLTIPGGRGGADVIGELLAIDSRARALVSSGYSTDPIMAEYEKWGFRAALPKPHTAEELLSAVQVALASG